MKFERADWKRFDIAQQNNDLNSGYFKTEEYKKYESFFKLKEAIEHILNNSDGKLTLLDVGCGSCWYAVYLEKENLIDRIDYNGIDISEHMCNNAKINYPNGKFYVHDIVDEKTKDLYDVVFEAAVLELVSDWKAAFHNMLKISKKWFIAHRLFVTEKQTYVEQVKTYFDLPDIRVHINKEEFARILNENGFELDKEDIWARSTYCMGTFVAKKIK